MKNLSKELDELLIQCFEQLGHVSENSNSVQLAANHFIKEEAQDIQIGVYLVPRYDPLPTYFILGFHTRYQKKK